MRALLLTLLTLFLALGVATPELQAFSQDSLTWKKCTSCHAPKNGKIARVEEIRTTPEEWAVIIDRMARLYGMELAPGEMNKLVKELCSTQGLTVEEAEKVNYLDLYNNTQHIETPQANDPEKLYVTCVRCHSAGKIYSYRMNQPSWAKVRDFHLYMVPTVVYQMREMRWVPEADAVLAELARSQAYGAAAKPSNASLSGSWFILGHEPGKGDYRGSAVIRDAADGDYTLIGSVQYDDGSSESFAGEASLYGGTAWRTTLRQNGAVVQGAFNYADGVLRGQRSYPAPNFRTAQSSWYPLSDKAQVLRVSPAYLVKGETTRLVVEGTNLPKVGKGDIGFSAKGVKVKSARRLSANAIEVEAVYDGKGAAQAKLEVKGLAAGELQLVAKIDRIEVIPELGRARVDSGTNFPAEGVQYEAIAYAEGDVALGPVTTNFSLQELVTRPGDDDLEWLGAIGKNGTYLPFTDYGPIEVRDMHNEGIGLVKFIAEYKRGDQNYTAAARLVVTEPDFIPRVK